MIKLLENHGWYLKRVVESHYHFKLPFKTRHSVSSSS
ncbi:type II toxin-antitoxin system HicA family toxin [Pueribacillus theae]